MDTTSLGCNFPQYSTYFVVIVAAITTKLCCHLPPLHCGEMRDVLLHLF